MIAVTEVPALQVGGCVVVRIKRIYLDRDVGVSVRSRYTMNIQNQSLILFSKPVHLMKESQSMKQFMTDVLSGDRDPLPETVPAKDQLLLSSFSPDIAGASNSVFDTVTFDTEWKV